MKTQHNEKIKFAAPFLNCAKNYEQGGEEIGGYWSIQVERPTNEAQHKHSQSKQNGNKPRKLCSKMKERYGITRSSWLNCALRDDEAVYWVSIGHYEAVAVGN